MSILRSMQTGAAGLRSHSEAIGVTGDNIANVNTAGFKRSRAVFADILGRSVAGGTAEPLPGAGSQLLKIQQMWTQGALLTTGAPTDLALDGDGLFIVSGSLGGAQGQFYSRAGQFTLSNDGYIVNPNNMRLQGYTADVQGRIGTSIGDIQIGARALPASATSSVDVATNLDATSALTAAWDPADPSGSSNFSTTVTVYDSLGGPHDLTVYFRRTGAGAWEWHAMADGGELTGGTPGVPTEGANGTLSFDTQGALTAETAGASSISFIDAAPNQAITFNFGTSIAEGGNGLDGSTQLAAPSAVAALTQDGFAGGQVSSIAIESDGTVMGVFVNGQRRALAQVVVADFRNLDGLTRAGQNAWAASITSGEPLVGIAGTGGRGSIISGALESSNVDLGTEFVDLISYQRGFSANSRIIMTADEMYQELVNIKR